MRRSIHIFPTLVLLYILCTLPIILSVADQPLNRFGFLPIPPTAFTLMVLSPFVVGAVVSDLRAHSARRTLLPVQANYLPLSAFFFLGAASLGGALLPTAYWEEGGKWVFLITYGLIVATCASYIPLHGLSLFSIQNIGLISLALVAGSLYHDFQVPGTYAPLTERPSGFSGNANYSALISVMIAAAALDYSCRRRGWFNILVFGVTAYIVIGTMSRSGAVELVTLLGAFAYFRLRDSSNLQREFRRIVVSFMCLALVAVGTVSYLANSVPAGGNQSRLYRLTHSKRVDDGSTASRLFAVQECLRRINESPIVGHGTGYARTLPELPHNLYLQQWVNNGLPGFLGYINFLGMSLYLFSTRRFRPGQAFILVALVGSCFSHNVLDQRTFLVLFGVLLTLSLHYPRPTIDRYSRVASAAP